MFLDNFGWGEPGFNGGGIIRGAATPRMDQLAAEGIRLTIFSEVKNYGMPRVYNLLTDPQERENVLFPNTWGPKAALGQLGEHAASLRANPPIKPGTKDPYEPR